MLAKLHLKNTYKRKYNSDLSNAVCANLTHGPQWRPSEGQFNLMNQCSRNDSRFSHLPVTSPLKEHLTWGRHDIAAVILQVPKIYNLARCVA